MTRKNWAFRQAFFGTVEKSAFYLYVDKIWGEFLEGRNFSLSILDDEQKVFGCKNCIQRVPRSIFLWSFFGKKCIFIYDFLFLSKTFQFLVETSPAGMPKQNSTCPPETLEKNYLFPKKLWVFLPFPQVSERLSALWRKLFGRVAKTAFDVSMGSYWKDFFEKKSDNFHNPRTLSKRFWAFSRRFSIRDVRKTI